MPRLFPWQAWLDCLTRRILPPSELVIKHPRFIMIGGFWGAGKTTMIARLGRYYQAQGKRVAIVTNDQATDLVDTHLLRAQSFNDCKRLTCSRRPS